MLFYKPGEIVQVRNARNKVGVYQIASEALSNSGGLYYKVFVLDFIYSTLPRVGVKFDIRMKPRQFLKLIKKCPEIAVSAQLHRTGMTTKDERNIIERLPFKEEQIVN